MASADFCRPMPRHSCVPPPPAVADLQNANLHPMYLPHLPPCAPGNGRVSFCCANSPAHSGLVCGFCSSGRDFAAGFLQIPPRDGHPCLWLTLLAVKRVTDFHRRVSAHAGHTHNNALAIITRALLKRLSSVFHPLVRSNSRIKSTKVVTASEGQAL